MILLRIGFTDGSDGPEGTLPLTAGLLTPPRGAGCHPARLLLPPPTRVSPDCLALTLSGRLSFSEDRAMVGRRRLLFLTTCSNASKPYMILKALDKSYKNHIGFGTIQAIGEEQQPPMSSHMCATVLSSRPERVNSIKSQSSSSLII